jgi:hypothetical protein
LGNPGSSATSSLSVSKPFPKREMEVSLDVFLERFMQISTRKSIESPCERGLTGTSGCEGFSIGNLVPRKEDEEPEVSLA